MNVRMMLVIVIAGYALQAGAGLTTDVPVIPPARAGLEPVPAPVLDPLEPMVRQQLETALDDFRRYADGDSVTDAGLANAYGSMGQLYLAYDFTDASRLCLLNASKLDPADYRWHHLLAHVDQQLGQVEDAVSHDLIAQTLRPESVPAAVSLGNLYQQLNDPEHARNQFQKALALDPRCAAAEAGLGQGALMEGKYEEAIAHLNAALRILPEANRLHYPLAMAYRGAGRKEEAAIHLARKGPVGVRAADELLDGLQQLRRGERIYLLEGQRAFNAGDFEAAAAAYAKSVEANPESVTGRINLASALAGLGETDRAIAEFREALRMVPSNPTAHFNLAMLLKQRGAEDECLAHLRAVLETVPNDLESHREVAQILVKKDRFDEAAPHLQSVVALDPTDEKARSILVRGLADSQRFKEAIAVLESTYNVLPDDPEVANELARFLAACPDVSLRDGERALELARASNRARPVIASGETVAFALAELGRCAEAAELQATMIEAAESSGQNGLAARLRNRLKVYESGPPCRP